MLYHYVAGYRNSQIYVIFKLGSDSQQEIVLVCFFSQPMLQVLECSTECVWLCAGVCLYCGGGGSQNSLFSISNVNKVKFMAWGLFSTSSSHNKYTVKEAIDL